MSLTCNPRAVTTWTRVYRIGGPGTGVAHYLEIAAETGCEGWDEDPDAIWLGTGSQHEQEVAVRLRLCLKCAAHREVNQR